MKRRIAIIDLGSNSVRLVVVQIGEEGSYHQVEDIKESVRLAESLADGSALSPRAMRHAVDIIRLFTALCRELNVETIIPIATAATRMAPNQQEFLKLLKEESGLSFRVLSGSEEAYYGYLGVVNTMHVDSGISVDVGGGSTEIVRFCDRRLVNDGNFPLGTINLTSRFSCDQPMTTHQMEELIGFLRQKYGAFPWLKTSKENVLVGMGGAVRSLSRIHRRRRHYMPDRTHGYVMTRQDVWEVLQDLGKMSVDERRMVPGLSEDRADIIVAGISLVYALMVEADLEYLVTCGSGLRDGLLFEYLFPKEGDPLVPSVLMYSIDNVMRYYGIQEAHARHVSNLALSLFDQLKSVHGYGTFERRILLVSALLCDAGITINYSDHQKHTLYLMTHGRLNGLNHRELVIAAYVVASRFRDFVQEGIKQYFEPHGPLHPEDIEAVERLGVLLRISNSLDRCGVKAVSFVHCEVSDSKVVVKAQTRKGAELELHDAMRAAGDFARLFGRTLEIVPQ